MAPLTYELSFGLSATIILVSFALFYVTVSFVYRIFKFVFVQTKSVFVGNSNESIASDTQQEAPNEIPKKDE